MAVKSDVSLNQILATMTEILSRDRDKEKTRRAERTIDKIPAMQKNDDVELYIQGIENELLQAGYPQDKWKAVLTSRLTPVMKELISDLQATPTTTFEDIKDRLLDCAGQTSTQAGQEFFELKPKEMKGKSTAQAIQLLLRLLTRATKDAPSKEMTLAKLVIAKARTMLSARGKQYIDSRIPRTIADLREVLQSWEATEGTLFAVPEKPRSSCFKCGKPGHRAAECFAMMSGAGNDTPKREDRPVFSCYTCGQPRHKSPDCPNKAESSNNRKDVDARKKDGRKALRNIRVSTSSDDANVILAMVEGKQLPLLLDTGAQISVMPAELVPTSAKTGDKVRIKGFNGVAELRDLAEVKIKVGDKEFVERVALADLDELEGKGLLALNLKKKDSWEIMSMLCDGEKSVRAVETRSVVKRREVSDREKEERELEEERVTVKPMNLTEVDKDEESVMGDGDITGGLELDASSDVEEEGEHPSVAGVEAEKADVVDGNEGPIDLPCMLQGDDRTKLVTETKEDKSLAHLRDLADRKERGYYWYDGILVSQKTDIFYGTVDRIVLPVARRRTVLDIVHEKSGHLGYRKVEKIIKRRFTWPLLSVDVRKHCTSCESCQKANKSGLRRAPMVERLVITEIFEKISVDIVGPLPKGKGGAEYILTIMCLASRWPEAVPLRTITARAIAEAMLPVFSRIGLPLEMLSDQGSQFTGKLAKEVCKLLQIKQVRTTAYHPQTNGAIEIPWYSGRDLSQSHC